MEAYRGEIGKIYHTILVAGENVAPDGPVMYTITDDDGTLVASGEATLPDTHEDAYNHYEATIGTDVTENKDRYTITWNYEVPDGAGGTESVTRTERLYIVTPVLTFERYVELFHGQDLLSYTDFKLLESSVRKVIESFCNQTFSKEVKSHSIYGNDSDKLLLPRRLVDLDAVEVLDPILNGAGDEEPYNITDYVTFDDDDRYIIRRRTTWSVDRFDSPVRDSRFFKHPKKYKVTGTWGWEHVPSSVERAAIILIDDYQCADAKYREKYLDNIRAGNWRMEFRVTGDETTGNANADMMLGEFRHIGAMVI